MRVLVDQLCTCLKHLRTTPFGSASCQRHTCGVDFSHALSECSPHRRAHGRVLICLSTGVCGRHRCTYWMTHAKKGCLMKHWGQTRKKVRAMAAAVPPRTWQF